MEDGEVCHSTCCNNTASENYMCERLVVEDIVHWAKTYKLDGFRCGNNRAVCLNQGPSNYPGSLLR